MSNNVIETIQFIESEMMIEEYFEKIINEAMTDDEFEEKANEFTKMFLIELSKTLNINYTSAEEYYNDYLTKNILSLI